MLTRLRWKKRAVRFSDETSAVRRVVSACGEYRVDRRESRYGLSTRFYALRRKEAPWGECWSIIGRHRRLKPAQRTCERHARRAAA